MTFDAELEIEYMKKQPGWIGVDSKIEEITKELIFLRQKLERDPKEWIEKKIKLLESDLQLFENILLFWILLIKKMQIVQKQIKYQAELAHKGAEILRLIEFYKEEQEFLSEENDVLSQTFVKLAETKGLDSKKINDVMMTLRRKTKAYSDFIDNKIATIVE